MNREWFRLSKNLLRCISLVDTSLCRVALHPLTDSPVYSTVATVLLRMPFTCMGGIKHHNLDDLLQRGAKHPAVVTAVTAQANICVAASSLW